jgi:hypothetical protein
MKTLLLTFALMATLVRSSYAVEYVTITAENPSVSLDPQDVVEIVGTYAGFSGYELEFYFSGRSFRTVLSPGRGTVVNGLTEIRGEQGSFRDGSNTFATLKITRAREINAVQPTSVLVIPENSTGNYNIVVETSSDTATWTPFHSQTVSAADAKRFFRTRIVKAE